MSTALFCNLWPIREKCSIISRENIHTGMERDKTERFVTRATETSRHRRRIKIHYANWSKEKIEKKMPAINLAEAWISGGMRRDERSGRLMGRYTVTKAPLLCLKNRHARMDLFIFIYFITGKHKTEPWNLWLSRDWIVPRRTRPDIEDAIDFFVSPVRLDLFFYFARNNNNKNVEGNIFVAGNTR